MKRTRSWTVEGSDGSAASGGNSDLSEWLRSADDDGVRAEEYAGHRNRIAGPYNPSSVTAYAVPPSPRGRQQ